MIALLFRLSLAALLIASLRAGDRGTKVVAIALAAAAIATELLRSDLAHRYEHLEWGVLGVDVVLCFALLAAAVSFSRWWITCATALQLSTVLGHVARLINPSIWPLAYAWMMQASSFPSLALLMVGILDARRRRQRPGPRGS